MWRNRKKAVMLFFLLGISGSIASLGDSEKEQLEAFAGIRTVRPATSTADARAYPFGNNVVYGEPIRLAVTLPVTSRGHGEFLSLLKHFIPSPLDSPPLNTPDTVGRSCQLQRISAGQLSPRQTIIFFFLVDTRIPNMSFSA